VKRRRRRRRRTVAIAALLVATATPAAAAATVTMIHWWLLQHLPARSRKHGSEEQECKMHLYVFVCTQGFLKYFSMAASLVQILRLPLFLP